MKGLQSKLLGVVGGMGPVTTARFLSSIYAYKQYDREQDMPSLIVYSDPTFPDRTDSFLRGDFDTLISRTISAIERLENAGAARIILCCFTLHHIVSSLPSHCRKRLILLTDVAIEAVSSAERTLLLCTKGSRKLGVFEKNPNWDSVAKNVVLPSEDDQEHIHDLIYKLKLNSDPVAAYLSLYSIMSKYNVDTCMFGCTDLHILSNIRSGDLPDNKRFKVVDPLLHVINMLHNGMLLSH